MRIAPLFALAGALLLAVSCSSKDDNGGASKVPSGVVASTDASSATSADGSATTAASAPAGSSETNSTDAAPATSLPSDPAAAIKAFYGLGGGTLSDPEATCVAGSTGNIVDSLNQALSGGVLDPATGKSLLKAFASCEPAAYVSQTTESLAAQSGATKDQATCVLHAVDKLFVADDAVLTQAAGNGAISEWPAPQHDAFSAAVKTCVPDDLATKIVDA
jgi:hypothetical protein